MGLGVEPIREFSSCRPIKMPLSMDLCPKTSAWLAEHLYRLAKVDMLCRGYCTLEPPTVFVYLTLHDRWLSKIFSERLFLQK